MATLLNVGAQGRRATLTVSRPEDITLKAILDSMPPPPSAPTASSAMAQSSSDAQDRKKEHPRAPGPPNFGDPRTGSEQREAERRRGAEQQARINSQLLAEAQEAEAAERWRRAQLERDLAKAQAAERSRRAQLEQDLAKAQRTEAAERSRREKLEQDLASKEAEWKAREKTERAEEEGRAREQEGRRRRGAEKQAEPFMGSQGQFRGPSIQHSVYHPPVERRSPPSNHQRDQPQSPMSLTFPQPSASYSVQHPVQPQPQFEGPGHDLRGPQQQQENSVPRYQQSAAPQYHEPQNPPPSPEYRRNPESLPSGYPRSPSPSPSGYATTHPLPPENTATSDVRHKRQDSNTSRDSSESVCMGTIFQQFDSSTPQGGHTGPTCRLLDCNCPVTRDVNTHELSEYCSEEHMEFVAVSLVLIVL